PARRKARLPPDSSIFRASCATAGAMIVPGAARRAVIGAWCCIVLSGCGRDQTSLGALPPALSSLMGSGGSTAPGSGSGGDVDGVVPRAAENGVVDGEAPLAD